MSVFEDAARVYWSAGWRGVLPLPETAKSPVPRGYTGWAGVDPTWPDIQAWIDGGVPIGRGQYRPVGNVALRLPRDAYGLDVDDYGGKTGGAALGALVEAYGPLPATWISSARDDSISGIRLFRARLLATDRRWRDEPGGHQAGIEAIHFGHRYMVASPSVHPETGSKYRWRRPDGSYAAEGEVPRLDDLPWLPDAWHGGLSEVGEIATGDMAGHAESVQRIEGWRGGAACQRTAEALARGISALSLARDGAALHPAARDAVHELVRLGHEGHRGAGRALSEHGAAFIEVRAGRRQLGEREAGEEWWRLVRGAVGKLYGPQAPRCDCELLDPGLFTFEVEIEPQLAPAGVSNAPSVDWLAMVEQSSVGGLADVSDPPGSAPVAPEPPVLADGGTLTLIERVDQADAYAEIARELMRRRVKREADDHEHAARWTAPGSHGSLAEELQIVDTDPTWRINGLLGYGHNAVIVAGRKIGKTTLVNELVRSLADGGAFLGSQRVEGGAGVVAIFNYEIDERQYRAWLRDLRIEHPERVHVLHLRGHTLALADRRVRAWVSEWLADRGVTAWIVDPFSRAILGTVENANDDTEVSRFLDFLDQVKLTAGVQELIMPTHSPKGFRGVEEGHETALGSQRVEAWADVMWYLTRGEQGKRYLRAEGRDVDWPERALNYAQDTRRLTVDFLGGNRADDRTSGNVDKLINWLREHPEQTLRSIMTEFGWSGKTAGEAVRAASSFLVIDAGPRGSRIHSVRQEG